MRDPNDRERAPRALDRADSVLQTVYLILLGVMAGVALVGAMLIMLTMDAASESQGGRVFVAVGASVALAWIESKVAWLVRRRQPLSLTAPSEPMRYRVLSVLGLLLAMAALFGCALLLPSS